MGKQSRKKGNKKDHKEKIKQRKQRVLEAVDTQPTDVDGDLNDDLPPSRREILDGIYPGDLVFYRKEPGYGEMKLCVVQGQVEAGHVPVPSSFEEEDDPSMVRILPIDTCCENTCDAIDIDTDPVPRSKVLLPMKHHPLALRFKVGDSVIVYEYDEYNGREASFSTVEKCWVGDAELQKIWPYESSGAYRIEDDTDEWIQKRPSSFRFVEGDGVLINTRLADTKIRIQGEHWLLGQVDAVDYISGARYWCYQVLFAYKGKRHLCQIYNDTDEEIASVKTTPRERLMESVEQDCSYDHVDYLVKHFRLDVALFQDQVLHRAIAHASYETVLWMQECLNVDLRSIVDDDDGSTFLHQICRSFKASDFFVKIAESNLDNSQDSKKLNLIDHTLGISKPLYSSTDRAGQPWFSDLLLQGDSRALEYIFSPIFGGIRRSQFYLLRFLKEEDQVRTLVADSQLKGHWDACRLFFFFCRNLRVHNFAFTMMMTNRSENFLEKEGTKQILEHASRAKACYPAYGRFANHSKNTFPKLLLRHMNLIDEAGIEEDWSVSDVVCYLVDWSQVETLHWLVDVDLSLLHFGEKQKDFSHISTGEFDQPELNKLEDENFGTWRMATLVERLLDRRSPFPPLEITSEEINTYFEIVNDFATSQFLRRQSLAKYLGSQEKDGLKRNLIKYRVGLLNDEDDLPRKLQVLDFLLQQGLPCFDPLEVIQHRQCGILRWMTTNGLVRLDSKISTESCPTFPGGQPVPKQMSVAVYFAFACIASDDIQTLLWLLEEHGLRLGDVRCHGWNIAHAIALFGRFEIAMSICDRDGWIALVQEEYRSSPWKNFHALHIAIQRGFTYLATFLVSGGCSIDGVKKICKSSKFAHVRKWGLEKERLDALAKDLRKLRLKLDVQPVNWASIRSVLESTGCLHIDRWRDADFWTCQQMGPTGETYEDFFLDCCMHLTSESVEWFCHYIYPLGSSLEKARFEAEQFWGLYGIRRVKAFCDDYETLLNSMVVTAKAEVEREVGIQLDKLPWARDWKLNPHSNMNLALLKLLTAIEDRPTIQEKVGKIILDQITGNLLMQAIDLCQDECVYHFRVGAEKEQIRGTLQNYELLVETSIIRMRRNRKADGDDSVSSAPLSLLHRGPTRINLDAICGIEIGETHTFRSMMFVGRQSISDLDCLYVALAIEGYSDLIQFCIEYGSNMDRTKETFICRVAAYFHYDSVVEVFLPSQAERSSAFNSSFEERSYAVLLGSSEAGYLADMSKWLEKYPRNLVDEDNRFVQVYAHDSEDTFEKQQTTLYQMDSSITVATVYGYLLHGRNGSLSILSLMVSQGLDIRTIIMAFDITLQGWFFENWQKYIMNFFRFLVSEFCFHPCQFPAEIQRITKNIEQRASVTSHYPGDLSSPLFQDWFNFLISFGFDVQGFNSDYRYNHFINALDVAKQSQKSSWIQFEPIKANQPLELIQARFEAGEFVLEQCDRLGLLCSHVSAAANRPDVLEWLVGKNMSLDAKDGSGRTVKQVAQASNSIDVVKLICEREIASFLGSIWRMQQKRRQFRNIRQYIIALQANFRGWVVRKMFRNQLILNFEESQRFNATWKGVFERITLTCVAISISWSELKQQIGDFTQAPGEAASDWKDTGTESILDTAVQVALATCVVDETSDGGEGLDIDKDVGREQPLARSMGTADGATDDGTNEDVENLSTDTSKLSDAKFTTTIVYTNNVAKWLRADNTYRILFIKRMRQLMKGQRGRKLAKPLNGTKTRVYESYLEQKTGFRILWTERLNGSLLVWYVAKHDDVSRLAKLIDEAHARSQRQLKSTSMLPELQHESDSHPNLTSQSTEVLLDPTGNTPLKLYETRFNEIEHMGEEAWRPRLHLTEEERETVEHSGTVLVLGRSGTGKTVCICNRIEHDRQLCTSEKTALPFRQLFVARSDRLCKFVSEIVGEATAPHTSDFVTFQNLLQRLEQNGLILQRASDNGSTRGSFLRSNKMTFSRFKSQVYTSKLCGGLDSMIVWTNIRTFIKGSIEASMSEGGFLSEAEYTGLGKRRCRLATAPRESVYKAFLLYRSYTSEHGLWDDCDRVLSLVRKVIKLRNENYDLFQEKLRYDKIYADEVQDYTQLEVLLFFLLSGADGLFLAGDPAQSVVEGVEFRFEDIRSVGYHICQAGSLNNVVIPDKPKVVSVNFRSHSGILNTAAGILRCMFAVFPDSAKQLKEDRGLFQGPRPSLLYRLDSAKVKDLVSKIDGVVVLTHDGSTSRWKRVLGGYPFVYGIREAKGLEFQSVLFLDFFQESDDSLQRPWRNLFLGRNLEDLGSVCPELEGQLKLLYTGVTRCINQLYFVETTSSIAGDAFVRWLTTPLGARTYKDTMLTEQSPKPLGVRSDVETVDQMLLTPDGWRALGLDNAILAESSSEEELENCLKLWERALYSFEQSRDLELCRKTRACMANTRFRHNLLEKKKGDTASTPFEIELAAAKCVDLLVMEGFFALARLTVTDALPFLCQYSHEQLAKRLLPALKDAGQQSVSYY